MNKKDLLASYWTLAGDVYPGANNLISPFSFEQRCKAAHKAGWKGIGLILEDLEFQISKYSLSTIKQILEDNDIKYLELEFLTDWYLDDQKRISSDLKRKKMIEYSAELKVNNIKVGADPIDHSTTDLDKIRDEFTQLCLELKTTQANAILEIMPFSRLANLKHASSLITKDTPNGGLCLDIWHTIRGNIPFSEISKLEKGFIKSIEINDASKKIQGDLLNDSNHNRKLCGQGDSDISGFINACRPSTHDIKFYGVEIISQQLRKLSVDLLADITYQTTINSLQSNILA
ncbi:xylose isomerase-like TIM barrel family protein [Acinetobacter baumannii 532279]|uniref:sugar phosphate isomerase/epimerase family protein n=1 Tax=Acinetobacter baumannii TaxID=470 RepID=UPI00044B097C|nr:TIM barrel protein [Acinetobacter baumannii]EXE88960.1 xylose isomerase-like TIM barrel family protein [Acinetobacter baumannii 532279]